MQDEGRQGVPVGRLDVEHSRFGLDFICLCFIRHLRRMWTATLTCGGISPTSALGLTSADLVLVGTHEQVPSITASVVDRTHQAVLHVPGSR